MSQAPHLLTEEQDAILIATLNRSEKLNAISGEMMQLFEAALHHFRDSPTLKVMLIKATGRYFSAGADMHSGGDRPAPPKSASAIRETHRLKLHGMHRIYDEMEAIEKPLVVAHHGPCVGGGLELSMSCDFRLASKSASYSFPEGKFGVLPASNGVSRLTRIVGTHWARYLIMANRAADADRALIMGLVHEVWPDDLFEAEVMRFCRHLAGQHAEQMGAAKIAIEMANDVGLAQARNVERMANSALMLNPEYRAGIEKYIQSIGSRGKGKSNSQAAAGDENFKMALYTTLHLHNVPSGREASYAAWFDGKHRTALAALRGFKGADRFEVTPQQIMADIPQPWRYMSVYDLDVPAASIDIPALGPLVAEARDSGLIADDDTERLYTYRLYDNWKGSPNWQKDKPLSGVSVILANYVAGRYAEYMKWYDEVHSVEVSNVPGHVAMKRGELSPVQIEPRRYCPGDQLVMCAQQTDDLAFTVKDFSARAGGRSPSGIAMQPRSSSGSFARTVHYFRKISGREFWREGIAYAGDLSVYPGKG